MKNANHPFRRSVTRLFLTLAVVTFVTQLASAAGDANTNRMAWFNQARFGMFIHWGLYAVPAGEYGSNKNYAEWIQLQAKIPGAEYAQYASQFDPTNFNAKEWVRVAKDAGMKYIVITAKHHDGFCMFDSKLTDYTIVKATPWHRDPMKDLAAECKKAGITFCFYYSDPDWHSPDFPAKYSQHGFHGNPNPDADLEKYVTYVKGQIRELLTGYGPIGIVWFDGGGSFNTEPGMRTDMPKLLHSQEIVDEIHQLQPATLVNNRLGIPADYGTPEQKIPGARPTNSFEVCMTLNGHWGYNKNDHKWKDAKTVIQNLVDIASKGGNYLLNVGPTSQGVFPPEAVQILGEVGDWMGANGGSIYGTQASPLDNAPAWGRITQEGNTLFLHVFDWPSDGKITVSGINAKVQRASFLGDTREAIRALPVEQSNPHEIQINIASVRRNPLDTVIVLECSGPIKAADTAKN